MDWSKIPDVLAITSLACAFASISRRNRTPQHHLWLMGWVLIAVHFIGFIFCNLPGIPGLVGLLVGLTALIAAGIFFMWATVPYESGVTCRRMASVTFLSMSIYTGLACLPSAPQWAFDVAAVLIAAGPLSVATYYRRHAQHRLRWLTVSFQFLLGAFLLVNEHTSWGSPDTAVNAILFTVYLGCCLYFLYSHRNGTTGSIITIGGFFAWAMVFVTAPSLSHFSPAIHLEDEVWNLPKYVVAIGMLLLLLEKQIERSQYLALHDDLTCLANRRLFQDRLLNAMERARRSGTSIALLQIDLDRFKEVNDSYGHHVGDLLLQHVSEVLDSRVRRSDTVARTGGDEFSLILEESSRREDAERVAESLVHTLSVPVDLAGRRIRIGASIGIAVFPEDAQDAETLCIAADSRMYIVKQHRREPARDLMKTSVSQIEKRTLVS
jgi:diguanylate cyclase (GGDEF)-like protein